MAEQTQGLLTLAQHKLGKGQALLSEDKWFKAAELG